MSQYNPLIPDVPGEIYGTGEQQDLNNGVPLQSNFYGMPGWWNPPTNWFSKSVNGQIFVSPNSDFSNPTHACKINLDGYYVFQDMMHLLKPSLPWPALRIVGGN